MSRFALLLFFFFVVLHVANAQTERNGYIAGGGLDISYTKIDTVNAFNMNIPVLFGYFIVKNLMLGMNLGIGLSSDNRAKNRESRLFVNTSFVPVIRYYFLKEKIRPFLYARFGYQGSSSLIRGNNNNRDGYTGGGGLGFSYFISQSLGLETSLGYNVSKLSTRPLVSQIGISVGLQYYFKYKLKDLGETE